MWYALAANALLLLHFAFIVFVVLGGLLLWRWPRLIWLHLPAFAWGAYVEINNRICPLTPWEQQFREAAGQGQYGGGFIEHYLLPLIYPEGLTDEIQMWLGIGVLAINLGLYAGWLWRMRMRPEVRQT